MGTSSMYDVCFSIMHLEESRQESVIRQSFKWQHRRKEKVEQLTGAGMDLQAGCIVACLFCVLVCRPERLYSEWSHSEIFSLFGLCEVV